METTKTDLWKWNLQTLTTESLLMQQDMYIMEEVHMNVTLIDTLH